MRQKRILRGMGSNWPLLLKLTLNTGMRKGEILNLTWMDVDFEAKTVEVTPKSDTDYTWKWLTKNAEQRLLPVEDEVISMLADHQSRQDAGVPYLFISGQRYGETQRLRRANK